MGQVWAGRHAATGVPVAVKVIAAPAARDPSYQALFEREVRAHARLDHPNIVRALDYGTVDDRAARASAGRLVAGSPYLVMDHVRGGSLADRPRCDSWAALRSLIVHLLDGLAHAHARGVLHRDVKPSNILVTVAWDEAGRWDVQLCDFGIASVAGGNRPIRSGTLLYIAPEQLAGRWRDQCPATDLYSLGCVIHHLAAGRPPFQSTGPDLAEAHLRQPAPPLAATFPVPDGLSEWLATLLQKDARDRYRCAADAAWSLIQLPEAAAVAETAPQLRLSDATTLGTLLLTQAFDVTRSGDVERRVAMLHDRPPFPEDWRAAAADVEDTPMGNTGVELFGLRSIATVGRTRERDALWSALGAVCAGGGPRAVVLRGPAGIGKSHLARWLTQRAHEVGAASTLRVTHSEAGSPADGLVPALARWLGVDGLTGQELRSRLEERVNRDDVDAVTSLVEGTATWGASERHLLISQMLEAGADRPVVIHVDDAQWGAESLTFVDAVLRAGRDLLAVMLVRSEALASRVLEPDLLDRVAAHDETVDLEIGPLPDADCGTLVRRLLGLEASLAGEVKDKMAGNPAFAVHLVTGLIERGALEPTDHGLVARAGAALEPPRGLAELWRDQVERVLASLAPDEELAVEVLGVLGGAADRGVWRAACAAAGARPTARAIATLSRSGLLAETDQTVALVHGMLAGGLMRRAEERGRLSALHRACAAAVSADRPERLAVHLLGCGEPEAAAPVVFAAAMRALAAGLPAPGRAWLRRYEIVLDQLSRPATDPDRLLALLMLSRVDRASMRYADALARAERAEEIARQLGDEEGIGRALLNQAQSHVVMHQPALAEPTVLRAIAVLAQAGAEQRHARARSVLGTVLHKQGRGAEAYAIEVATLAYWRGVGDVHEQAISEWQLSHVCAGLGRTEEAVRWAEAARGRFLSLGRRVDAAKVDINLGEALRQAGRSDDAERVVAPALEVLAAAGAPSVVVPLVNLGSMYVEQRRFDEALPLLRRSLAHFPAAWAPLRAQTLAMMLPPLAHTGQWEAFDAAAEEAEALIEATGATADQGVTEPVRWAEEMATERGQPQRAAAARRIRLQLEGSTP